MRTPNLGAKRRAEVTEHVSIRVTAPTDDAAGPSTVARPHASLDQPQDSDTKSATPAKKSASKASAAPRKRKSDPEIRPTTEAHKPAQPRNPYAGINAEHGIVGQSLHPAPVPASRHILKEELDTTPHTDLAPVVEVEEEDMTPMETQESVPTLLDVDVEKPVEVLPENGSDSTLDVVEVKHVDDSVDAVDLITEVPKPLEANDQKVDAAEAPADLSLSTSSSSDTLSNEIQDMISPPESHDLDNQKPTYAQGAKVPDATEPVSPPVSPVHEDQAEAPFEQEKPDVTITKPADVSPPASMISTDLTGSTLQQTDLRSSEVDDLLPPGTPISFADLEIVRLIGSGSFGRVHLAVHRATGARVALKSLLKSELVRLKQVDHTVAEKEALECTSRSSAATTFGHASKAAVAAAGTRTGFPFVVKLYGTFQDPLRVYFVMEHVAGGELFSLLRDREKLEDHEARFYSCEVALALEHLHGLGIIYRDLKPENVMLDARGHVKLVDFGFAKVLGSSGETYTLCGTPEYLAPEVIQPVSPTGGYSAAVDWWSFGVLIYEMIAGHPPFFVDPPADGDDDATAGGGGGDGDGDDEDEPPVPLELYRKILDGRVGYPPWMAAATKDLVRRLLVVDPDRRLGARLGDVESHPWFDGIDWDAVLAGRWESPPAGPDEVERLAEDGVESDLEEDEIMSGAALAAAMATVDPHAALFADF
ncbi:hypothetical protein HK405_003283 [Cladochytrium tenue]|nr:hypothetical protein HK405_003283 [Cladochytrium tenue]